MRPKLVLARGIYHCKYLATEFSEYWKAQGRIPTPQQLGDTKAISKAIQREQQWEPTLSDSFLVQAKVFEYCGLPVPCSQGDRAVPGSGRGGLGTAGGLANRTTTQPGSNSHFNNVNFNSQLFGSYRTSSVRCAVKFAVALRPGISWLCPYLRLTNKQCAWLGIAKANAM